MKEQRKQYTPEVKVAILKWHLLEKENHSAEQERIAYLEKIQRFWPSLWRSTSG